MARAPFIARVRTFALVMLRATAFVLLVVPLASRAEAGSPSIIRDAEIESTIRAYATPLFQVAGLSPRSIDIYLIDDDSLNAFVLPGGAMFIHTGLLMRAEDPAQVIGVIAHETGHIAAGHYISRGEELRAASLKALAATLLGIGAAVATGDGRAGAAAVSIGQDIALKGLLTFTRSQESAADQAAITYLRGAKLSPEGLLAFMHILEDQEVLLASSQDPYLRTHPLTRQRVEALEQAVAASPYAGAKVPPEFVEMHARMRAKLVGFLRPQAVARLYPESDQSLPARYARSIAFFRSGHLDRALALLEDLIGERPDDPYFHELKGQMLLENGRIAEAVPSYRRAVELRPDEPQLRLRLADTLVQLDREESDREALEHLNRVLAREPDNAFAWRLAAVAHGRLGNDGMTSLALAEMNFAQGNWQDARLQAERAQRILPSHTPAALRASDLEAVAKRNQRREQKR